MFIIVSFNRCDIKIFCTSGNKKRSNEIYLLRPNLCSIYELYPSQYRYNEICGWRIHLCIDNGWLVFDCLIKQFLQSPDVGRIVKKNSLGVNIRRTHKYTHVCQRRSQDLRGATNNFSEVAQIFLGWGAKSQNFLSFCIFLSKIR